jgi:hypothetical protein
MAELTREERLQLTQRLADSIIGVIGTHKHGMALDALLAVYRAVAKRYECCTKTAADACFDSAVELAQHAAEQRVQKQGAEPGATASQTSNCTDMSSAELLNVSNAHRGQANGIHVDQLAARRGAQASCES